MTVHPLPAAGLVLSGSLQAAVGITGLSLLLASGATCQPLAPTLLTAGEMGADPDAGWAEVAVDDDPLARLQSPQLLHRDQGAVVGRLGGGDSAGRVGRVVGLGDRLVADQLGAELQRTHVGQPGEEDLGPVAVEDGGGPIPVAMDQMGLVMPDRQQLDALPPPSGG